MTEPARKAPTKSLTRPTLRAVGLGLLTFAATPLAALAVALPLLLSGEPPEAFNPVLIVAKLLELQDLGGFFAAQMIFMGLMALTGDFAAAMISWRTSRSKRLATITFLSALAFQCAALGLLLPITIERSHQVMAAGIAREQAYRQYAAIGEIGCAVREPYDDREITNLHPEFGPLYRELEIAVPISVVQAGTYRVAVSYSFSRGGVSGSTRTKELTSALAAEEHTFKIAFSANEAGGSYGYWTPSEAGGRARVQLSYLAAQADSVNQGRAVSRFVDLQEAQF